MYLNDTTAPVSSGLFWGNTAPTSTQFTIGSSGATGQNGVTYIAYLFAHNAGGFGLTGNDNVITCGSFTTDGSGNATVNLGYEPQWVLMKVSTTGGGWQLADVMRGMSQTQINQLVPNTSAIEGSVSGNYWFPTATGFQLANAWGSVSQTYIYIAIRRGPMKVPTVGTSVFSPTAANNPTDTKNTTNFPIALQLGKYRNIVSNILAEDRLRGISTTSTSSGQTLRTNTTNAEDVVAWTRGWDNTGFLTPVAYASTSTILWNFQRAPGFFDEVCYTGTGSAQNVTHNLGVVPELIIVKGRPSVENWAVYSSALANTEYLVLNTTAAKATGATRWNSTTPTSSVFSIGTATEVNTSSDTYVAYLFATCPGVSKVGSYSGTGATQTIDCGFTGGARFVLIKRTNSTGDWYVWDTARGMIAGTDPSLLLNSDAAEVNANSVYTTGVGFQIVSTAAGINASGGTYIFLAVA
jgi:hypothetical protein